MDNTKHGNVRKLNTQKLTTRARIEDLSDGDALVLGLLSYSATKLWNAANWERQEEWTSTGRIHSYPDQAKPMVTAGVRELKNKTSEILRKVREEGPVIVTSHGKPIAAVIPLTEEEVEDFLLAHSPKVHEAVLRGIENLKNGGPTYTPEELLKELEENTGE